MGVQKLLGAVPNASGGCKSFLGGGGVRTPQKIRAWGAQGAEHPNIVVSSTPSREVQHNPKTFSAFQIAISGTSTVSMCPFLETIDLTDL